MTARHVFLAHTAETILRLEASDLSALWAEACRAMGGVFVEEVGSSGPADDRLVVVEGIDADAVLVNLLNELVYVAEAEQWAPQQAEVVGWGDLRLTLRVSGVTLKRSPARVKGATHHGARLVEGPEGVSTEVILDV